MLICFKCIRHIELDHCEIYYSINECQMIYLNSQSRGNSEPDHEM